MSIEKLLTDLTAALHRNSDALEALNAKAGANKPTTPVPAKADKGADKAADKPADKKPVGRPPKAKGPTIEKLAEVFTEYMKTGSAADREEAKQNCKAICEHFGAARATLIPEDKWAEAIEAVETFKRGETPNFLDSGDEGDEDEDDDNPMV